MSTPSARQAAGFTLAELAVVLLILALLAGPLTAGLSARVALQAEQRTDEALAEARDSLLGHLVRHNRLPCPAKSPTDGAEAYDGSQCAHHNGLLPWATLGIRGEDGWSRRLRYAVTPAYTKPLAHLEDGKLEVFTRNLDGAELSLTTTTGQSPAVILSHGANGLGATHTDGSPQASPITGTDEARNATANGTRFYSRTLSENPGAPGGAFDDRVTWLSPNLVAYHLSSAGKLP
ncbi:MAG: prepilin-type N-terminal cleavage/methylation domain-containing protein [Zoogloea sp.]|nr:prepilin-type N-terminal cleavage/methylation domain-containing protein [Zoogloea sp.]MCA0188268.1 prepilin-type N-terminal cleavage/methylation domain-containing protein [Pseudomonadota bacterium]